MRQNQWLSGAKGAIPVCLGLLPVGISFGLLAVQAGMSRLQTVLMSAMVMAGSSQLMAVGMLGQASLFSIVLATFFVNLRHLVMSGFVMERLKDSPLRARLACAFALCDESFAIFSLSGSDSPRYLLGANTALYLSWIASSFAGSVLGQFLPEVIAQGFGIAFYASFLAMLTPSTARSRGIALLVLLSAGINALLRLVLPSSWAVILSMVAGAALGTYFVEVPDDESK